MEPHSATTDNELHDWLIWAREHSTSFLHAIAESGICLGPEALPIAAARPPQPEEDVSRKNAATRSCELAREGFERFPIDTRTGGSAHGVVGRLVSGILCRRLFRNEHEGI